MITFRKLAPDSRIPEKATANASCYDAYAHLPINTVIRFFDSQNQERITRLDAPQIVIEPGCRFLIPLGWAVNTGNLSMRLFSRSGLALRSGLVVLNGVGIIDADYRHEVFALIGNISNVPEYVMDESRICQVEFIKTHLHDEFKTIECEDAEWFDTARLGGFGSTGVE